MYVNREDMLSKKQVMELYNRLAKNRFAIIERVPLLDYLSNLKDGSKILDVATGTGVVVFKILEKVVPEVVIGIDLSVKELIKAKNVVKEFNLENVHFLRSDGENLGFRDNFFDVVTCNAGLHWMPHKEKCVKEMLRVCRKGGLVAVYIPDKSLDHAQFMQVALDVASKYNLKNQVSRFKHPSYNKDEAEEIFKSAGAKEVRIRRIRREFYYKTAIDYLAEWKRWGGDKIFKSLLPPKYKEQIWNEIASELNRRYQTNRGVKIISASLYIEATK